LRKIPTSDGLALVFYTAKKEPVECALEIARANRTHRTGNYAWACTPA